MKIQILTAKIQDTSSLLSDDFRVKLPLLVSLTAVALFPMATAGDLEFNRDVRPILSENCFHCHGQDPAHREADLRLDTKEGLHGLSENGEPIIIPGKPEESLLWDRITSNSPDLVMPPPDSHRSLSPEQINTLQQWIREGAPFEGHWAFKPPTRKPLPTTTHPAHQDWDAWIHEGLTGTSLSPAPPASPSRWLRRASFDLNGLSPTPAELDAFEAEVATHGNAAYADAADRLLASPRFGEHMATAWLDVARYADTHGFNNDTTRTMWRWRDWVIEAFNRNLPYNDFITHQLAGDLLPDADIESHIATGFNRNHGINSEGGIIGEEYRVEYVNDRVRTAGTAWLGLTLECARCHDHKYDNISQADYYRLFAFFNQVPEAGEAGRINNAAPVMRAPTRDQRTAFRNLTAQLAAAEKALPEPSPSSTFSPPPAAKDDQRIDLLTQLDFTKAGEEPHHTEWRPAGRKPLTFSSWVRWDGKEGVLFSSINYGGEPSAQGYGRGVELRVLADGRVDIRFSEFWPGYVDQLRSVNALQPGRWQAVTLVNTGGHDSGARRLFLDFQEEELELLGDGLSGGGNGGKAVLGQAQGGPADRFNGIIAAATAWPTALDQNALDLHLESTLTADAPWTLARPNLLAARQALQENPAYRSAHEQVRETRRKRLELHRAMPNSMVMTDLPETRPSFILKRGAYDARGEQVEAGVMEELLLSWPTDAPKNRLGLAQWITHPQHPLTSRVVVNRFWQQVFGIGLVKTADDFGVQGEYPSHPELLDWLARDFVDHGWDVKRLMKSLVLSSTYRQDSRQNSATASLDPENRLLARGPRVRLSAESIRDHALHSGGLLVEQVGGASVRPFQPEGFYNGTVVGADYPSTKWVEDTGDNLFRRSLYTFWKRTVPHPLMTGFDMPDREFCVATRSRTNTPLQALALLNEKGLLHAAGGLGQRMLTHAPDNSAKGIAFGFRTTTGRQPDEAESLMLKKAYAEALADWQTDPDSAAAFLANCGIPNPEAPTKLATYALLGSLLLNLDETVTKH